MESKWLFLLPHYLNGPCLSKHKLRGLDLNYRNNQASGTTVGSEVLVLCVEVGDELPWDTSCALSPFHPLQNEPSAQHQWMPPTEVLRWPLHCSQSIRGQRRTLFCSAGKTTCSSRSAKQWVNDGFLVWQRASETIHQRLGGNGCGAVLQVPGGPPEQRNGLDWQAAQKNQSRLPFLKRLRPFDVYSQLLGMSTAASTRSNAVIRWGTASVQAMPNAHTC